MDRNMHMPHREKLAGPLSRTVYELNNDNTRVKLCPSIINILLHFLRFSVVIFNVEWPSRTIRRRQRIVHSRRALRLGCHRSLRLSQSAILCRRCFVSVRIVWQWNMELNAPYSTCPLSAYMKLNGTASLYSARWATQCREKWTDKHTTRILCVKYLSFTKKANEAVLVNTHTGLSGIFSISPYSIGIMFVWMGHSVVRGAGPQIADILSMVCVCVCMRACWLNLVLSTYLEAVNSNGLCPFFSQWQMNST